MNPRSFTCLWICLLGLFALAASGCSRYQPRNRSVVVMDFENNVTDASKAVLSQSLADFLTASLANQARVTVIDRQGIQWLLDEAFDKPVRWQDVGRKVEADYLVVGSVAQLDDNFIISARIFSVPSGKIVPGSAVTRYCKREEDLYPVTQAIARIIGFNLKVLAERHDARHGFNATGNYVGQAAQMSVH